MSKLKSLDYAGQKPDPKTIQTLVFSGGGALGIGYSGAVEELFKHVDRNQIKTYAGSSAGAITAMILALGYDVDEIKSIIENTKFGEFLDLGLVNLNELIKDPQKYLKENPWAALVIGVAIFGTFALCPGEVARKFLAKLITDQGLREDITFKQLFNHSNGVSLRVTVCNIGHTQEQYIEHNSYPNVKVLDAVYASMAIPFIFKPMYFQNERNNCAVDGGTVDNLPVYKMDNWLAFVLGAKDKILHPPFKPVETLIDYINGLLLTLQKTVFNQIFIEQANIDRTIFIDTKDYGGLDFDMDEKEKKELIKAGTDAVKDYFADLKL